MVENMGKEGPLLLYHDMFVTRLACACLSSMHVLHMSVRVLARLTCGQFVAQALLKVEKPTVLGASGCLELLRFADFCFWVGCTSCWVAE